MEMIEVTMKRF